MLEVGAKKSAAPMDNSGRKSQPREAVVQVLSGEQRADDLDSVH